MLNHVAQVGDVHRSSLVRPIISPLGGCGCLWVGVEKDLWSVPGQCIYLYIEDTRYMRWYNAKLNLASMKNKHRSICAMFFSLQEPAMNE